MQIEIVMLKENRTRRLPTRQAKACWMVIVLNDVLSAPWRKTRHRVRRVSGERYSAGRWRSDCGLTMLVCADANYIEDVGNVDLAVADSAGSCASQDRLNHRIGLLI